MNNPVRPTESDTRILILGLCSFLLWPFTAVPGILMGRRQAALSPRGRLGYRLCWICLILFCLHLLMLGVLLLVGRHG